MKSKLVLFAVCAAPLFAGAAEEKLDIRTGSWEITATSQISGMPPLSKEMLAKMTPKERAEIEAVYKAEAAKGPQTSMTHECITDEDVEQPFASAASEDCTQTIVRTTRTTQEARLVCSGEHQGSGLLRVTAPNPETMTASVDMRAGEGPEALTIKSQMKGRWLGAECEDDEEYDEEYEEYDEEDDTSAPDEYDEPEDD